MVHVLALALVRVELLLNSRLCFRLSAREVCWELHIAKFADSQHRNVFDAPNDPKFLLDTEPITDGFLFGFVLAKLYFLFSHLSGMINSGLSFFVCDLSK